eukprot:TRINITY_DN1953_c0_g1_i2.p2 TRINITY_DN1953_c0_g1~~TRINITY_DN1953_c0_g1_i2.p2  ORF type:complete len:127 (+),score=32.62 TRINITY_DN1953_c0_g1_i2:349-729(+)
MQKMHIHPKIKAFTHANTSTLRRLITMRRTIIIITTIINLINLINLCNRCNFNCNINCNINININISISPSLRSPMIDGESLLEVSFLCSFGGVESISISLPSPSQQSDSSTWFFDRYTQSQHLLL